MNIENIRHFYEYHFTVNRRIWDKCVMALTDEQFLQELPYSLGSIRNQTVHMANIDARWFSALRGEPLPPFATFTDFPDRASVRAEWDRVEAMMRERLAELTDERLQDWLDDDQDAKVWQMLIHVVNHGTDHRAQLLAGLNSLGVQTFPQDYAFFIFGIDPSVPRT